MERLDILFKAAKQQNTLAAIECLGVVNREFKKGVIKTEDELIDTFKKRMLELYGVALD